MGVVGQNRGKKLVEEGKPTRERKLLPYKLLHQWHTVSCLAAFLCSAYTGR